MSCQHKRPGRKARNERIERARRRKEKKAEEARRRARIVVHFPAARSRFDAISPGRLIAWVDGRQSC